jgi:hypothetical protein
MGKLCRQHEEAAEARLRTRVRRTARRIQAPAITVAVAIAALFVGRASGRLG